jgi:YVTN family beta-propeller protein
LTAVFVLGASCLFAADEQDRLKVGVQPDGRIVVPTNQILKPAGKQITFPGRPVDLALDQDGKVLVVKNMRSLVFIDLMSERIFQTLALPEGGNPRPGFSVVGLVVHKNRVYASDAQNLVRIAIRRNDGSYEWARQHIELEKPKVGKLVHPAGLAMMGDDKLWVCSTRGNHVQLVDLATNKVEQVVDVGVAPYMPVVASENHVFVSNWGGDPPKEGDPQAKTSDTPIKVDPRTSIASEGTLSLLRKVDGKWKLAQSVPVGLHPCALLDTPLMLYVANANSDTVSVLDKVKSEVCETINCRPTGRLPFGSGSNALAIDPKQPFLYVANGTNNCVAVVRLGAKSSSEPPFGNQAVKSEVVGLIPTGWYPGAVLVSKDGKKIFVANIKGHGSLSQPRPDDRGKNTHDHLGSVSIIDTPDAAQLARYTQEVNKNNRLAYSLAGLEKPRSDAKPLPVPERHGEPSVFKHVIYVIKENRTYDQVFGALKEGNGDPNLVLFGEEVTPNHHALARQFTLFDNFYCSGVLSADGHNWVNEAYVTDYLERSFGGWTRSYPDDGTDPLAQPATGHLWDNAFAHKKTVYNFGEYVTNEYPKGVTWTDFYNDYKSGEFKLKVPSKATVKALEPVTHPGYPWFPCHMPDVYRARLFTDELRKWEQAGTMPNLVYVTLPCNHTEGTRPEYPTPRAMVADNDLALGQIVEAVSKSKFWKETCILVVEDDPQNGFDHVDAHRTVAFAISPYTKRRFVDHTNYNQTGMVKTIELILGLPPMNQLDLSATAMRDCFQATPDLTPYAAVPNRIPLDEMNKPLSQLSGKALYWAKKSLELNLDEGDKADEDTLNRILWHAVRGYDTPYPERFAGRKREED